jgi:DNA-binding beta-propeller fold protein YncE
MKNIFTLLLVSLACTASAQNHKLVKLWETDTIIAVPESVLPVGDILYVALIDGDPWGADGKGGIAKIQTNGKVVNPYWVHGLNAPKGMAKVGNRLYVADISEVAVIDIASGKVVKKIKVEGAEGLNDVTVTSTGILFVSDSKKATVWKIEKDRPKLYLENMQGINGLRAVRNELYIASGKSFVKADLKKKITLVATLPEGGDGVEPIGNGDFIATAWGGQIYYVSADGKVETVLDTTPQKKNTADIGYDAVKRIVYVPTFFGKTVSAYRLQ